MPFDRNVGCLYELLGNPLQGISCGLYRNSIIALDFCDRGGGGDAKHTKAGRKRMNGKKRHQMGVLFGSQLQRQIKRYSVTLRAVKIEMNILYAMMQNPLTHKNYSQTDLKRTPIPDHNVNQNFCSRRDAAEIGATRRPVDNSVGKRPGILSISVTPPQIAVKEN